MGALFLDGVQIGDDDRYAYGSDFSSAPKRERTGMSAMELAMVAIDLKARLAVRTMIKTRARAFERRPIELHAIPGLAAWSTPAQIIATCECLLEQPSRSRWGGMGGEVPRINLKAAILHARWRRRVERAEGLAA